MKLECAAATMLTATHNNTLLGRELGLWRDDNGFRHLSEKQAIAAIQVAWDLRNLCQSRKSRSAKSQ
jgi:hypothetical protein